MSLTRRTFIGLGSLAACGTALRTRSLFAADDAVQELAFSLNEKNALAFVRSYSADFRVIGASVLGRIRKNEFGELHLLVDAGDRRRLFGALSAVKFAGLYAEGNSLSCAFADVDVTIENLSTGDFSARLAALGKPAGNVFAHDALSYNPETKELSDPFAAQTGGVKLTGGTPGEPAALPEGPAALDAVLRGTFDAAQFGLSEGSDFAAWKTRVLGAVARAEDARKFAEIFLRHLATLAGKLPASGIEALLRSRLVASALRQAYGADTGKAATEFKRLRGKSAVEITNGALWLAALIAPAIKRRAADAAATAWVMHGTRFQALRSRAALAQAQTLVAVR